MNRKIPHRHHAPYMAALEWLGGHKCTMFALFCLPHASKQAKSDLTHSEADAGDHARMPNSATLSSMCQAPCRQNQDACSLLGGCLSQRSIHRHLLRVFQSAANKNSRQRNNSAILHAVTMPPTNSPLLGSTGPNSYLPNQSSYESISWLENIATRCSTSTIQSISGASAGLASCIAACPLDVIKTNLQGAGGLPTQSLGSASASVRRPLQDRGLLGTGRLIWREGGFRGMYRGLAPAMLAFLPRWTVYITVYHESNEALTTRFGRCIDFPLPIVLFTLDC